MCEQRALVSSARMLATGPSASDHTGATLAQSEAIVRAPRLSSLHGSAALRDLRAMPFGLDQQVWEPRSRRCSMFGTVARNGGHLFAESPDAFDVLHCDRRLPTPHLARRDFARRGCARPRNVVGCRSSCKRRGGAWGGIFRSRASSAGFSNDQAFLDRGVEARYGAWSPQPRRWLLRGKVLGVIKVRHAIQKLAKGPVVSEANEEGELESDYANILEISPETSGLALEGA